MSAAMLQERAWHAGARVAGVVGVLCAVGAWGWQLTVASAVSTGFLFVIVCLPFTEGTWAAMRRLYARGALTGTALVAASGLLVVGRLAGGVVVLMLAGSSPRVRRTVRSRWPTVPDEAVVAPDEPESVHVPETAELRELDDPALCLVWRRTFVMLEASRSARHRLRVVRLREAILDELQRRSPAGFEAWLAAGARAPSNPMPFVSRATGGRRSSSPPPC